MGDTSPAPERKKGRGDNRRTEVLQCRLTPAEKRQAEAAAAAAGVRISTYARACILSAGQPAGPIKDPSTRSPRTQARDELVKQLNAIGINLNQIARVANTTGDLRRAEQLDFLCQQLIEKVPDIK